MIERSAQHRFAVKHAGLLLLIVLQFLGTGCRVLHRRANQKELDNARQLLMRGNDALDRDRHQDAEALFAEALQKCPSDERMHGGYAHSLWHRGAKDLAIEHMQEAVRISGMSKKPNPEYMIRLGEWKLEKGDSEAARLLAQQAIAEDHRNPEAWSLLGNAHRALKQWDRSLEFYQRALLLQPDFPEVQLAIADTYRQIGRPQRAIATLDRMVDLHPTGQPAPDSLLIRGLALADLGRNKDALATLNRAADKMPRERLDEHLQLATAQYRLGDLVEARMSIGRVLQTSPEHAEAKRLQSTLDMTFQHLAQPMLQENNVIIR